jgi:hypothetical protein
MPQFSQTPKRFLIASTGRRRVRPKPLLKAVKRALKPARIRAGGMAVRLQWCPGHAGLAGNEAADVEPAPSHRANPFPLPPPGLPARLSSTNQPVHTEACESPGGLDYVLNYVVELYQGGRFSLQVVCTTVQRAFPVVVQRYSCAEPV